MRSMQPALGMRERLGPAEAATPKITMVKGSASCPPSYSWGLQRRSTAGGSGMGSERH